MNQVLGFIFLLLLGQSLMAEEVEHGFSDFPLYTEQVVYVCGDPEMSFADVKEPKSFEIVLTFKGLYNKFQSNKDSCTQRWIDHITFEKVWEAHLDFFSRTGSIESTELEKPPSLNTDFDAVLRNWNHYLDKRSKQVDFYRAMLKKVDQELTPRGLYYLTETFKFVVFPESDSQNTPQLALETWSTLLDTPEGFSFFKDSIYRFLTGSKQIEFYSRTEEWPAVEAKLKKLMTANKSLKLKNKQTLSRLLVMATQMHKPLSHYDDVKSQNFFNLLFKSSKYAKPYEQKERRRLQSFVDYFDSFFKSFQPKTKIEAEFLISYSITLYSCPETPESESDFSVWVFCDGLEPLISAINSGDASLWKKLSPWFKDSLWSENPFWKQIRNYYFLESNSPEGAVGILSGLVLNMGRDLPQLRSKLRKTPFQPVDSSDLAIDRAAFWNSVLDTLIVLENPKTINSKLNELFPQIIGDQSQPLENYKHWAFFGVMRSLTVAAPFAPSVKVFFDLLKDPIRFTQFIETSFSHQGPKSFEHQKTKILQFLPQTARSDFYIQGLTHLSSVPLQPEYFKNVEFFLDSGLRSSIVDKKGGRLFGLFKRLSKKIVEFSSSECIEDRELKSDSTLRRYIYKTHGSQFLTDKCDSGCFCSLGRDPDTLKRF
jgi:hypothetical protein